jgi:hypothetical protein
LRTSFLAHLSFSFVHRVWFLSWIVKVWNFMGAFWEKHVAYLKLKGFNFNFVVSSLGVKLQFSSFNCKGSTLSLTNLIWHMSLQITLQSKFSFTYLTLNLVIPNFVFIYFYFGTICQNLCFTGQSLNLWLFINKFLSRSFFTVNWPC